MKLSEAPPPELIGLCGTTLRELQVHPPGCQVWHPRVLAASPSGLLVACASTLSICVYAISAKPITLVKLVTGHAKNITCICWSPVDEDKVVSCGADGEVVVWSLALDSPEPRLHTMTLPATCLSIAWGAATPLHLAFPCIDGAVYIWALNPDSAGTFVEGYSRKEMVTIGGVKECNVATAAQWNPKNPGKLLAGHLDGTWVVWGAASRKLAGKPHAPSKEGAKGSRVVDVAWDPLGGDLALIAHKSGFVILWDVEAAAELNVFERQPLGIRALAWLEFAPGSFMTLNETTAVAKVWQVSQTSPTEHVRVAGVGVSTSGVDAAWADVSRRSDSNHIHAALPIPKSASMLLSFLDGSVAIFNWKRRRLEWRSGAAHTETIFDCSFCPSDPNVLATASYDGTVVLWYLPTMSIVKVLHAGESDEYLKSDLAAARGKKWNTASSLADSDFGCVLYSVAWSPDGAELATASLTGMVRIFSAETGKVTAAPEVHSGPCYRVHWYTGGDKVVGVRGLLASAGGDASAVVLDRTGHELMRYTMPAASFGIEWSPAPPTDDNVAYLAAGCANGNAYVFGVRLTTDHVTRNVDAPLLVLSGHKERVFHVAWSPLVPFLIATGSDDTMIKVWSLGDALAEATEAPPRALPLTVGARRTLSGHTRRVRPLAWNHEIPSLLLSGSWDSRTIAWDVSQDSSEHQQLCIARHHIADIYGLASHPSRPFVYASCSRDNTLRVFCLSGPVDQARLRATVAMRFPAYLIAPPPTADALLRGSSSSESKGVSARNTASPLQLCGAAAAELSVLMQGSGASFDLRKGVQVAASWKRLLDFFEGPTGTGDLWHIASDSLRGREVVPPTVLRVVATHQVLQLKREQALTLESARLGMMSQARRKGGIADGLKKDDALLAAADAHLLSGNIADTCRLLTELGQWNLALALSPGVGLSFWKNLMAEHAALIDLRGPSAGMAVRAAGGSGTSTMELASGDAAFLIAAGQAEKATNFLVSRGDFVDALCVAAAIAAGRFENGDGRLSSAASAASRQGEDKAATKAEDVAESSELLRAVCSCMAGQFMLQAQPHYAAATMLGAGFPAEAVALLARGWDLEAAFGVATAFAHCRGVDRARAGLLPLLAARARLIGDLPLSLALVREAAAGGDAGADVEVYASFLASDLHCSEDEADALLSTAGVSRGQRLANDAAAAEERGDMLGAARLWLLAQRHAKAATALGNVLSDLAMRWSWQRGLVDVPTTPSRTLSPPDESLAQIATLIHALDLRRITDAGLRKATAAWACWVGGRLADTSFSPLLDLRSMAAPLFRTCRRLDAGVAPPCALLCAEAAALLRCDRRSNPGAAIADLVAQARELLSLVAEGAPDARGGDTREAAELARVAVQRLDKLRDDAAAGGKRLEWEVEGPSDLLGKATGKYVLGPVVPIGARIPSGQRAITKGEAVLPPLSRADAAMWGVLCPNFPLTLEPQLLLRR